MISNVRSSIFLIAIVSFCLCVNGCSKHRDQEPPPIITIVILDEWDSFLLDGQRVDRSTLESRLQRMATEHMREITGTSRAYVRITARSQQDAKRNEKNSLMRYCISIGLDKIQFH